MHSVAGGHRIRRFWSAWGGDGGFRLNAAGRLVDSGVWGFHCFMGLWVCSLKNKRTIWTKMAPEPTIFSGILLAIYEEDHLLGSPAKVSGTLNFKPHLRRVESLRTCVFASQGGHCTYILSSKTHSLTYSFYTRTPAKHWSND